MKLTVIILSIILIAALAAGAAMAQNTAPKSIRGDLDNLTLQADDLSNSVESQLVDLNIAANNTSASSAGQADVTRSIAARGASNADLYEAQLSGMENSLSSIQSRYNSGQYGHGDATAIESRISYLQNRIGHIRNMINDVRISADRIGRQA